MAFQAGAIVSKLTLDRSKFSASVKAVRKQTKSLGGWVKKNSGQFKAMGVAAAAAGAAVLLVFKKMVTQFVETGDMIHKMSIRTGFAAETLSELSYAAEISGADINMLEKGVKKMSKTIVDASYGLETYLRVFRGLGIEIDDIMKLSPEQQFLTLGAAISKVENQTLKTAAAVDIFGRAGTMLLPFFAEGAEGMAKLREEAHTLGIIFDEETAAKAAALKDAQTALTGSVKGLSIAILTDLIPVITSVTKKFTDWFVKNRAHAGSWTKALLGAFQFIAKGIEGLLLAWQGLKTGVFLVAEALTKSIVKIAEGLLWIAKLTPGTEIFYAEKLRDIIRDLTFVSEGYREEKEKGIDTMTDIIEKYEKFVAMLSRVGEKTKVAIEKQKEFGTVIVDSVLPPARQLGKVLDKVVTEMETGITNVAKTWEEKFWGMYQDAAQFTSALGGLFNQMSENEMATLDRDYERKKSYIENSLMNEEEKAAAMERLDKQFEKRRKQAMRAQAKRTKALGVMESIIATAAAVAKALPNIPLAIAVGIMGAIQTALIAAQPLPALAKGGAIGTAGIVGEEGPELFLPATPGTIIPLRTEAGAMGGAAITMTFLGPLISTTGVARADLERAGNTLWDIIGMQARRRGYSLNGT